MDSGKHWGSATRRGRYGSHGHVIERFTRPCCWLEGHLVSAFEIEQLPRLVRRGNLQTELLKYAPNFSDLIRVTLSELASTDIETVLQADAYVTSHQARHGCHRRLMLPGSKDGPVIVVAEKPVSGPLLMKQVFDMRPHATAQPENRLHKKRRLHQAFFKEMMERVEMTNVVAFELETRSTVVPHMLKDPFDVFVGVTEDQTAGSLKKRLLPVISPFAVAISHF